MSNLLHRTLAAPALVLAAWLAGCSSTPRLPPPAAVPAAPAAAATETPPAQTILRAHSRWVPAPWTDLPGWDQDRSGEIWAAFQRGCERPAAAWAAVCADARINLGAQGGDAATRTWLQQHLQPYRVESNDGIAEGLITGYFEPLVEASRVSTKAFRIPLYAPPLDLNGRKPYWTRQQMDTLPAAQAGLRGRALAYVADPLDALILQIQGSGRLQLTEADGSRQAGARRLRRPQRPAVQVGRPLADRPGRAAGRPASWPAIKAWARLNPQRLDELLWSNPRVVFFREEPLPDPQLGPEGRAGGAAARRAARSRSTRKASRTAPPVWIDTTEPLSNTPLRRAVMAQDTGSAITGAVRADYFWGWGEARRGAGWAHEAAAAAVGAVAEGAG